MVKSTASMNTTLNIKKLDGNIVQRHESSKQVGLKQLGSKKFQTTWWNRKAEVFQVSNNDTVVAQRRLEDKQPKEKINTDCLVKEQEKEYQTGWKIKTVIQQQKGLVDETNVTLFAKVCCFLIQSCLSKVFWAKDTTRCTYLVNRSPSSAIGFKKPIDMLVFFRWLASIKQWMLKPVKVKCIFLGYHKSIVGTDSIHVLHGFKFEVESLGDHTFEVEPQENDDQGAGLQEVQTQDLMDYQLAHDRKQHLAFACEVISKWKAGLKDDIDARSDVYVLSNGCKKSNDDNHDYYWEYAPAKGNVLGLEIIRDQSGNTLRVSQSKIYNRKLVQTLLDGHSILSLEGSLSRDYDVEKNGKWSCIYAVGSHEYQMVCTRLDIASVDVGMLDKFDRGLQINVQHMEALSTTEAGYMTFTEAWKKEIRLKGLLTESRYELRLVAGIATGALVKGGSRSEVLAQVKVVAYRY
ncbi:hypothetical protein Tco_0913615 [Tanacetum coccineum]